MEWVREVFVAEVHPKQNKYGCVVLILDGAKTHIALSNMTECKTFRVNIPVLPAYSTHVMQPPDQTIFGALTRAVKRLERKRKRECKGRAASPASFVEL